MVRTVVVDEALLMHEALRVVLHRTGSFVVVGSARSVGEGVAQVRRQQPDLVVCEYDIPGGTGLGLARWIRGHCPRTRVVLLTGRADLAFARCAIDAGASAVLLKTLLPDELVGRLRDVLAGLIVVDERIGQGSAASRLRADLSDRQAEVLEAMMAGLDNTMIAQRLCIAHDTVKSHVKAILRKLEARDRTHAVAIALGVAEPN